MLQWLLEATVETEVPTLPCNRNSVPNIVGRRRAANKNFHTRLWITSNATLEAAASWLTAEAMVVTRRFGGD